MAEQLPANRWWRLIGALSMNFALGGFLIWSIFARPLELEFGWTRSQIASAFTIRNFAFVLTFLLGARLQDKRGPLWVSVIGGVLYGIGFFFCAWTTTLPWLLFWLGVVAGAGQGFGYAPRFRSWPSGSPTGAASPLDS